jgi:hypothetical protein
VCCVDPEITNALSARCASRYCLCFEAFQCKIKCHYCQVYVEHCGIGRLNNPISSCDLEFVSWVVARGSLTE